MRSICAGPQPVFADIEADGYNIDPAAVAALITPRTRAILCVHQVGMPCDLPALAAIARQHGLRLVEDAACASGSEIQIDGAWRRIAEVWVQRNAVGAFGVDSEGAAEAFPEARGLEGLFLCSISWVVRHFDCQFGD
jgi:dTDP-4-amino-4,6-dideoxygalactose transaminase